MVRPLFPGQPGGPDLLNEGLIFSLLVCGIIMFCVGAVDDITQLSPQRKLLFQILVASGMYLAGFRIRELSIPFGEPLHLGWFSAPLTVLWIVGLTNATNLLDGMDGRWPAWPPSWPFRWP